LACPITKTKEIVAGQSDEKPPAKCPYVAEHLMMRDQVEDMHERKEILRQLKEEVEKQNALEKQRFWKLRI
jgi:hypothetical protein